MSGYYGDYAEDSTVRLGLTTNAAAGGAVAPSSAFEAADIRIYKDSSATQKTTTNGITMTSPFDSVVGLHDVVIDTSNDTGDAGFWATGSDYRVVLVPDETVDGQTVAHIIGEFSIENRGVAGAKAVWDRILTGATHNIATSAGRRLRGIQEFQGYENGAVWIDTVNGTAGTVDYENGTVENPSSTLADALTIAASLGMTRFEVVNGSSITLAATTSNKVFAGDRWTLAFGGQDVGGSHFEGASVSGVATGTEFHLNECNIGVSTLSTFHATECRMSGTVTLSATGEYHLWGCHSGIAGTSAPIIDTGVAVANVNLNIRQHSGGIELQNLGQLGADTASIEGNGQIILNANCVGGTVAIRGNFELTNNGSGITIVDEPRYDSDTLVDLVWDEVLTAATHNVQFSSGKRMRGIEEYQGYEEGSIYIDTLNGTAGSDAYTNGTVDTPVDNIADANILAATLNINHFHVANGSSITFAAAQEDQYFFGLRWTLALGGQSISNTVIEGADVSGIATGAIKPTFKTCDMDGSTIPGISQLFECALSGDLTLNSIGTAYFVRCYSGVAGTSTPSVDVGVALGNNNVNFRHYSGGIEFKNLGQVGTDNASVEGNGQVVFNANCTGGTVAIRGNFTVTDNAGGAVTVSDDARYDTAQVNAEVVDALSVDTYAEPGQGAPAATTSLAAKINYLFKWVRNKKTNDGSTTKFYDDAGTTVDHKQTTSSAAGTVTKGEIESGP
jgi:hypothetical protein